MEITVAEFSIFEFLKGDISANIRKVFYHLKCCESTIYAASLSLYWHVPRQGGNCTRQVKFYGNRCC